MQQKLAFTADGNANGTAVLEDSWAVSYHRKVKMKLLSRVQLLAIPWTAAYQAPLSMGFSRQRYWSGVPLLSLEVLQ